MGRKADVPGVRRDKVSSSARGFRSISVTVATKTQFLALCAGRKPDEVLAGMMGKAPAPGGVPWGAIRDALLAEFGFIHHEKVDRALKAAGMP